MLSWVEHEKKLYNLGASLFLSNVWYHMGLDTRKPVFGDLRTTKAQANLCIQAAWSAPLLFAN